MDIAAALEQLIASPFFVGGAGALVSLRFAPEGDGWSRRLATLVCGALVAGYCAHPLADWLKLTKATDRLGVAFALGLLGLSIIAAVLKAVGELKVADIISGWISRGKG